MYLVHYTMDGDTWTTWTYETYAEVSAALQWCRDHGARRAWLERDHPAQTLPDGTLLRIFQGLQRVGLAPHVGAGGETVTIQAAALRVQCTPAQAIALGQAARTWRTQAEALAAIETLRQGDAREATPA